MAYPLRNRNNVNRMTEEDSNNENGYNSSNSDTDFLRHRRNPPRAAAQKSRKLTNAWLNGNSSIENDEPESSDKGKNKRKKQKTSFSDQPEPETKISLFSWLIFREILNSDQKICYIDEQSKELKLAGKVRPGGILCSCCNQLVTPQRFESHACRNGEFLANNNPYKNIFLPRNRCCLQECMVQAWNHPEEISRWRFYDFASQQNGDNRSDDVCIMCADAGDLFYCERCPSAYHLACMGMMRIPSVNWLCPYCLCKHCGNGDRELRTCKHCTKKYHQKCAPAERGLLSSGSDSFPFCGYECTKVHFGLKAMLGVNNALEDGFSWTLLQRQEIPASSSFDEGDILKLENNAKIAVASAVLNEVFPKTLDQHTQINILESVVYSRESNLTRINFNGFYVAVLEKKGQMISAATIRVHGVELAEMPFVGTCDSYRRQGMSHMLLKSIQSTLRSLKVQKLVIPSVPGLHSVWTKKLSFSPEDDDTMRDLRQLNALMFPSANRLQKYLLPSRGRRNQD